MREFAKFFLLAAVVAVASSSAVALAQDEGAPAAAPAMPVHQRLGRVLGRASGSRQGGITMQPCLPQGAGRGDEAYTIRMPCLRRGAV